MKKSLLLIYSLLLAGVLFAQEPPATLRDSLLQVYSLEQLQSMTIAEFREARDKVRGIKPTAALEKDGFGIALVKDIPATALAQVRQRVAQINQKLNACSKQVFPNAIIDAYRMQYRNFYQSALSRELENPDYKLTIEVDIDGADTTLFSNCTRRTYYFNQDQQLRLITVEHQYNVNQGGQVPYVDERPINYLKESYYVWADSLQFYQKFKGQHALEPDMEFTPDLLDTTRVSTYEQQSYLYQNNVFLLKTREGSFDQEDWLQQAQALPYQTSEYTSNRPVILFNNLLQEYREYQLSQNDYLQPVQTSFTKPYKQ